MNDVVVIGGGAAGLMSAIAAAENGAKVVLLEPNERLGKKINITGKGRCNVTNDTDLDGLMSNIPRNGRFLYSALSRFSSRDTMAFFEQAGAALKVERGNRVFPQSDSAFTITDALKRRVKETGVQWVRDRAVDIAVTDGAVTAVHGQRDTYKADRVVIATGGCSYPGTGSTGDGYRLAERLGHTIVEPRGSLVPLVSDDGCCREMQGLALKNVELTVYNTKNKAVFREMGEMLFTHFGISGPLVLSASAHLRDWDKGGYRVSIDLKPALDQQKLDSRILRDISENPNRDAEKLVAGLVAHSMVAVMMRRLGWEKGLKCHSITKEQRRKLMELLKDFSLFVTGVRPVAEAIVTAGGVKVGEVSPNTMESKLVSGLYFAGEVLDVDAYTGGFNLQIAWATGRLAGLSAAEKEEW
ncbi:MAG: NAD(P)/FAD-dependent oxidoreductase [Oscillospiraceae bacterium]|nr:NAD(P)/FAD-dependent oxidoreductase [Oscillospiraceae bacterium]